MAVAKPLLTEIMQGLGPGKCVAEMILPRCTPTAIRSVQGSDFAFSYYKVGDRIFRNTEGSNLVVADGVAPNRIRMDLEDAEGTAQPRISDFALNIIKKRHQNNLTNYERSVVAPALKARQDIALERACFSMLTSSTNFTNGVTGATGSYWNEAITDIVAQFLTQADTIQKATGLAPTLFVVAKDAWSQFVNNPSIKALFGDADRAVTRAGVEEKFAELIGDFDPEAGKRFRIVIAGASYDSANIGQSSATNTYVYTNAAFLGAFAPDGLAAPEYPSAAYHFELEPYAVEAFEDKPVNDYIWRATRVSQPTAVTNAAGVRFASICSNL